MFVPAYQKMLELSRSTRLPDSSDGRRIIPEMSGILPLFSDYEQKQITQIIEEYKTIATGDTLYPVLADNMM